MSNEQAFFIGVDVGTGSVRAALVSGNGRVICTENVLTKTWNPQQDYYEQSSEDIWNACVKCVKAVTNGVSSNKIRGIGFDATCSLVCIDKNGNPLSISTSGNNEQNIILWLDHRATKETSKINELNHEVLKYVGGKISPEMETPKMLWLKDNLKAQCWDHVGGFFDLPDFLTWKATGCDARSLCSLVCKWTYEIKSEKDHGWNENYFKQIGLDDLKENNWSKIGSKVQDPGKPVGNGLSDLAAKEFGLLPGTPVGTSMIDAHAGGLALAGCSVKNVDSNFHTRLCLICGTSTCHMAVSKFPTFTPGVWGPYFSAMIPGMWLNEGGQSATGKFIDFIIDSHPATPRIKEKVKDMHIQEYLSKMLGKMAKQKNLSSEAFLTEDLHMWPDYHGNRSPLADPTLKGMVSGLTLSNDEENLALLYLASIQALAYGTRHILETLQQSGYSEIKTLAICGGLSKNMLFNQTQADVVNLPVICPYESESVLLGASILGACAANYFKDIETAIKSMGGSGSIVQPNSNVVEFHNRKYRVFLKMVEDQNLYRKIMKA